MSDDFDVQLGVDVAEGGDQTVVAVRRGERIEELAVWVEPDLMQTVERVRQVADRYGVTVRRDGSAMAARFGLDDGSREPMGRIVVDAIGVGAGVAHRLYELGYRVESFKGNAAPPRPRSQHEMTFANLRAAAYFQFREWQKRGSLPPDRMLDEEVLASTYGFTAGKTQIEDKKGLRRRLGRSPDRLDACVLAVWNDPGRVTGLCVTIAEFNRLGVSPW